ncbi:type III secretion apparatus needle protein [Pseudochelatococcus lubricantis]|uniref:Type III secretion apparatus needle protein n=1 Tax=Pseudochelatococcus lubricantis TaxID=1538102 RepID=A0ABX0V2H0_9HYPH|nr:EscF/YscF/HrpA family type III secretion system needle major subunit [Pseudochelatococcus lubricantis]NIJ59411.1 type III secretion apparatus needle protein [Pseudochelatococcus lubricantis]
MAITQFDAGAAIRSSLTPATIANKDTFKLPEEDGLDLIWAQSHMGEQMRSIEAEIQAIEANANLSDTERMFAMQIAMNTWSAISNLRTNIIKSVADTLKGIVRNIQ